MNTLTDKQLDVYKRACKIFGDKMDDKSDAVILKIKATDLIHTEEFNDKRVKDFLNDTIYDSNLFSRYIVPPFSVLDTKQGYWKKRKTVLDEYLGSSIGGRKGNLTFSSNLKVRKDDNGTSQFDSVLAELILKWWGFENCFVYDCFSGGHIRGTMASLLGYKYVGIDLSTEQIEANKKRGTELGLRDVVWLNDDSSNVDKYIQDNSIDLFFSCPPYGDLEKYTEDDRDLSNMEYEEFIPVYNEIIRKGVNKLKDDRFAVFVVGDFRDERGMYRGFVKDTICAFEDAGMCLYNELILLNAIGTAPMRANNTFRSRKVVKIHQNILVFYKGDVTQIKQTYTKVDSALPILKEND